MIRWSSANSHLPVLLTSTPSCKLAHFLVGRTLPGRACMSSGLPSLATHPLTHLRLSLAITCHNCGYHACILPHLCLSLASTCHTSSPHLCQCPWMHNRQATRVSYLVLVFQCSLTDLSFNQSSHNFRHLTSHLLSPYTTALTDTLLSPHTSSPYTPHTF